MKEYKFRLDVEMKGTCVFRPKSVKKKVLILTKSMSLQWKSHWGSAAIILNNNIFETKMSDSFLFVILSITNV